MLVSGKLELDIFTEATDLVPGAMAGDLFVCCSPIVLDVEFHQHFACPIHQPRHHRVRWRYSLVDTVLQVQLELAELFSPLSYTALDERA